MPQAELSKSLAEPLYGLRSGIKIQMALLMGIRLDFFTTRMDESKILISLYFLKICRLMSVRTVGGPYKSAAGRRQGSNGSSADNELY